MEQMAKDLAALEYQLDVWKQGAGEIQIPRQGKAAVGLQLLPAAARGVTSG